MTFLYCINDEKKQKKSFMLVDLLYKNGSRYHILRVNECASETRNVKFRIVVLTNATLLQVKTSAFSL